MLSKKTHIILVLCLLVLSATWGQEPVRPVLHIDGSDSGLMKATVTMPTPTMHAEGDFCHLAATAGTEASNGEPGQPLLPTASALVRLPKGSVLTLAEWSSADEAELGLPSPSLPLAPATAAWTKEGPRPTYTTDPKIYSTDAYWRGGEPFEVENLGAMGRWQLFRLTARPAAYNPVQGKMKVCHSMQATLKVVTEAPAAPADDTETLLVVARSEFHDALQPFVEWKRREGYRVEELYTDTNHNTSIRAQMAPHFEQADALNPAPRYVLLVGDHGLMNSFAGQTSVDGVSHHTDLHYADYTGDNLPDALLGRWPVNDTAELRTVVEKTLRYEQYVGMDTLQLKRLLLVAGRENTSPAPLTTNGQVDYLKRELLTAHPAMDTVCFYNPQSGDMADSVKAAIGQGASLLNYTAHCQTSGWTSPAINAAEVASVEQRQPTVFINNCCKSNTFVSTGFGEELLRMPAGGAVAVAGATNTTLWLEDYYWAVGAKVPVTAHADYDSLARGAFDAIAGRHPTTSTMGGMMEAGLLAVMASGSRHGLLYTEIYCLLGDPTLRPWIGVPQPATLRLDDTLRDGQSIVRLAGTPRTTVTVMQDNEVIGVATIGTDSTATMALRRTLTASPVAVTTTGAGLQPRTDSLPVAAATATGVTLRRVAVADSMVTFAVENIGQLPTDSLRVVLWQSRTDSTAGAWLTPRQASLPPIAPGEDTTLTLPVSISSIGTTAMWQATLALWRDSMECPVTLRGLVATALPTLDLTLTDARGDTATALVPGGRYTLQATVSGPYTRLTIEAEALPAPTVIAEGGRLDFDVPAGACTVRIAGETGLDQWWQRKEYWIETGNRREGFEQGTGARPWHLDGRTPWHLDSSETHSGHYSLRSGAIDHGQTTKACIDVTLATEGEVSYWVKTSTEARYDKMVFSIDDRYQLPEAWGIEGWSQRRHTLSAGRHTLCWRYTKDDADSRGEDCVWIDDIEFPLVLWDRAGSWDCPDTTASVGLAEALPAGMTVIPNPAAGRLLIATAEAGAVIAVRDATGRTVATLVADGNGHATWDATRAPAGVYYATCIGCALPATQKIIIMKQ